MNILNLSLKKKKNNPFHNYFAKLNEGCLTFVSLSIAVQFTWVIMLLSNVFSVSDLTYELDVRFFFQTFLFALSWIQNNDYDYGSYIPAKQVFTKQKVS